MSLHKKTEVQNAADVMLRYDTVRLYQRAPKSCRLASLIYTARNEKRKKQGKEPKTKAGITQKMRSTWQSVESVLREEKSYGWEGFVQQVGLSRE